MICFDRSVISNAENATRPPTRDLAKACDRALGAEGALLDLHAAITAEEEQSGRRAHGDSALRVGDNGLGGSPSPPDEGGYEWGDDHRAAIDPEGGMDVPTSRRGLIRGGLGGIVGAVALGSGGLGSLGSLDDGRGLLGHFRNMRAALADDDNLFGAARVIPVAVDQLARLDELHDGFSTGALKESFQVRAELADLIGWLYQDSGHHEKARDWLNQALDYAHFAGREDSIAFILARKGQLAADMRDPARAIAVGEAGVARSAGNARLAAIPATHAAHGHALAGHDYECDRLYDQARDLLAAHGGDESPWGQFFGIPYLEVHRAHSHAVLGDFLAAAEGYAEVVSAVGPSFRRDQGVYLARQAHACARSGDQEAGAELGMQALGLNSETGSSRGIDELMRLWATLAGSDTGSAHQFREAMREVTMTRRA